MPIFKRSGRGESPEEDLRLLPDQEPEHSPEAQAELNRMDEAIASSEALAAGLGRVAREGGILAGSEAYDEIYSLKKIGKGKLRSRDDARVFESAGRGLAVRNLVKRLVTLGLAGSKYAIKGETGLADKRKLKAEAGKYVMTPDELMEAAEKFGLRPEEVNPRDLRKTYVRGEKGVEKVYLRKKTEQEMDETAGEILLRNLEDLEKAGAELVRQKQGLEVFKQEKEKNKDILDERDMAKLADEEEGRQRLADEKQEELDRGLDHIRRPLLEQQTGLAEAVAGFSPMLADATEQEDVYAQEITSLQDKIRRIKGARQIAELLGDKIKDWEEQKKLAEANLKDFREKKQALSKRIAELKRIQAEVNAALIRLNRIGKTPAEARQAQERKITEPEALDNDLADDAAERQRAEGHDRDSLDLENSADETDGGWEASFRAADDAAAEEQSKKNLARKAAKAKAPGAAAQTEADDWADRQARTQASRNKRINKVDQAANEVAESADQGEAGVPDDTDDYEDLAAAEREKIAYDNEAAAERRRNISSGQAGRAWPRAEDEAKGWFGRLAQRWFRPKKGLGQAKDLAGAETPRAEAPAEPEMRPGREQRAERIEKTMAAGEWQDRIFGIVLNKDADTVAKKYFRVVLSRPYDPTVRMTLGQAMRAYIGYLGEYKGMRQAEAQKTAQEHFARTFKNEPVILSDLWAAERKPAGAPAPERPGAARGEKLDLRLTAEELEDIYSPDKARALVEAQNSRAAGSAQGAISPEPVKAIRQGSPIGDLEKVYDQAVAARFAAPEQRQPEAQGKISKEKNQALSPDAASKGVEIPFMITRDMEQQLADLGYTKNQRKKLTPERVHAIIKEGVKFTAPAVQAQAPTPEQQKQAEALAADLAKGLAQAGAESWKKSEGDAKQEADSASAHSGGTEPASQGPAKPTVVEKEPATAASEQTSAPDRQGEGEKIQQNLSKWKKAFKDPLPKKVIDYIAEQLVIKPKEIKATDVPQDLFIDTYADYLVKKGGARNLDDAREAIRKELKD